MRRLETLLLAVALCAPAFPAAKDKTPMTDDRLYDEVRRRLANDPDVKGGALEVDVHQGAVVIKGKVSTEKARSKAEKLAHKVKGVTSVQNGLVVETK